MSQKYDVSKIDAKNVAIGNHAKAGYPSQGNAVQSPAQLEALQQIRQLIELLPAYMDKIESPRTVQADVRAAETALGKKKLNRDRIEGLVGKIAAAVAGVTALANAIDAVQTAVTRLFT
jgi:hypothetical protein